MVGSSWTGWWKAVAKVMKAARSLRMSSGSSTTTITIFIRYFYFSKRAESETVRTKKGQKRDKLIKVAETRNTEKGR